MKVEEYNKHADHRKGGKKGKKTFSEGNDIVARKARVSFKNYVRQLEEDFLETDLDDFDDLDVQP